MKPLTSLARISTAVAFVGAVAMANACGGQSFTSGNDDGGSSNAGTGQGGSTSHAGTHSTAGKATGGTGIAGTSYGGTGVTAGAGGVGGGDACNASPESGQCEAAFQRWYHNPATGTCEPFIWGGCGGNANRYESQAACEAACPGPVDVYACKVPSDCIVTTAGCCGVCDGPGLTAQNFVAFNKNYGGLPCGLATNALPAGGTGAGFPGRVACPSCPAPAPGQGTAKYFVPDCVRNQCVVSDLRASALTACKSSAECKLRSGTSCCEGCGGSDNYVAVRNDGSFEKAACGSEPQACPACAPLPPANAVAWCDPMAGHCTLSYAMPIGG